LFWLSALAFELTTDTSDFAACYDGLSPPEKLFETEIEPLLGNAFEGKARVL
jgi:hypothetical protein